MEWDSEDMLDYAVRPEVEALAQKEWELYLPELALKNISGSFDRRTIQAFTMMSRGIPVNEIAAKLGIAESSVYVYKKRVKEKLVEEIARLQKEL